MREIRLSGSEGGGALTGSPYPYPNPTGRFSLTNCLKPIQLGRFPLHPARKTSPTYPC